MAWNVMEQLNKNAQKAAVGDETPKARFRTKDINIKKLYSNDKNFYSVTDIEPLAQDHSRRKKMARTEAACGTRLYRF